MSRETSSTLAPSRSLSVPSTTTTSPGEMPLAIAVVSPCGICRELIHDYDANARVIVPDNGRAPKVVSIGELLPNKYKRGSE